MVNVLLFFDRQHVDKANFLKEQMQGILWLLHENYSYEAGHTV